MRYCMSLMDAKMNLIEKAYYRISGRTEATSDFFLTTWFGFLPKECRIQILAGEWGCEYDEFMWNQVEKEYERPV